MGFNGTCCISHLHQICIILIYECDAEKNQPCFPCTYINMTHSQILGKIEYTLPAKF